MFNTRVRMLASTVLIGGALTLSSIGSAFAAPIVPDATSVPAAAATATTTTAQSRPRDRVFDRLFSGFLKPLATLFGVSRQTVAKDLLQGQTLTQIAGTYGKSATDVETALMGTLKARLDHLVSTGRITPAQETRILAAAPAKITKLVNANLSKPMKALQARRAHHQAGRPAGHSTATSQPQS